MTTTASPRRRARTRAIATSLGLALALVLATAGAPAGASVTVSAPADDPPRYEHGELVDVSGTEPTAAADRYAIAQCVVFDFATGPVTPGTRCSTSSALPLAALTGGTTYTVNDYELEQSWTQSKDYTNPTSTPFSDDVDCVFEDNDPSVAHICALVVSYYDTPNYPAPPYTPVGSDQFVLAY